MNAAKRVMPVCVRYRFSLLWLILWVLFLGYVPFAFSEAQVATIKGPLKVHYGEDGDPVTLEYRLEGMLPQCSASSYSPPEVELYKLRNQLIASSQKGGGLVVMDDQNKLLSRWGNQTISMVLHDMSNEKEGFYQLRFHQCDGTVLAHTTLVEKADNTFDETPMIPLENDKALPYLKFPENVHSVHLRYLNNKALDLPPYTTIPVRLEDGVKDIWLKYELNTSEPPESPYCTATSFLFYQQEKSVVSDPVTAFELDGQLVDYKNGEPGSYFHADAYYMNGGLAFKLRLEGKVKSQDRIYLHVRRSGCADRNSEFIHLLTDEQLMHSTISPTDAHSTNVILTKGTRYSAGEGESISETIFIVVATGVVIAFVLAAIDICL